MDITTFWLIVIYVVCYVGGAFGFVALLLALFNAFTKGRTEYVLMPFVGTLVSIGFMSVLLYSLSGHVVCVFGCAAVTGYILYRINKTTPVFGA